MVTGLFFILYDYEIVWTIYYEKIKNNTTLLKKVHSAEKYQY